MAVHGVVSVVIQKITDLLIQESIIFNKQIDEVERIRIDLREMQSFLKEAEDKQESDETIKKWVEDFLSTVYVVEDVIETFVLGTKRLRRMPFVGNIFTVKKLNDSRKLRMQIERIKEEIKKLEKGSSKCDIRRSSYQDKGQSQHQKIISSFSVEKESDNITGFEEDIRTLVTQLTDFFDRRRRIISIVGEGGSGKTTLAMELYNHSNIKGDFELRAWILVSKDAVVKDILLDILRKIIRSKEEEKLTHEELKGILYECLWEKKYLIVMDDVCTPNVWHELQDAFPDNNNGSRVMFTTCEEDVAFLARPLWRHYVKPLSDQDSWKLFLNKLHLADDNLFSDSEIPNLKEKIMKKCKGLPLAILLIGGLLSTKNVREWSKVLEHPNWQLDGTQFPFSIIVASFNDLPCHLRPCFLYLGLFPKNFKIPVRRLFRLWLAEGFVKHSPGMTPEDLVEEQLDELAMRNMIQIVTRRSDGSPKTCCMPSILHKIFLSKAQKIGLFHIHEASNDTSIADSVQFGIRRVVEYVDINSYPRSEHIEHLRSYLSFNIRKKDMQAVEIGDFLCKIIGNRGFGLLRVLDLEGIYKPRLPGKLGNLFHLRYLGLRWTFLDNLPSSVSDLAYLETLDVKHTYINTLPNSIWKMKHLRHLCLNEIRLDMSVQKPNRGSLTQLQTLWGLFVDKKSPVKNGLNRLINLRKLGLTCHSTSVPDIVEWIARLVGLQKLKLRSKEEMGRPSELNLGHSLSSLEHLSHLHLLGKLPKLVDMYEFPPKLRVLTLSVSHLAEDPMPTLAELPSLTVLRLLAGSYIGKNMHCPRQGFGALRILKLWMLLELEEWTVAKEAMKNLQELEIRCCNRLKKFPESLLDIKTIGKLIFTNMPQDFIDDFKKNEDRMHTTVTIYNNLEF